MTQLHPALDATLAGNGAGATIFGVLKIVLPDATLRLVDGSAEISISETGGTFVYAGEDPEFGVWDAVDDFEDGAGDNAPGMTVRLLPASDEAAATLSDPDNQGSPISYAVAARNDATGVVIGEPYPLLFGEIEVPVHRFGGTENTVDLDVVGGMEQLFFEDEGIRLAQSFHEQVWPGELGFSHVTGVTANVYWGVKGKDATSSPGGTTGGGGSGGGFTENMPSF